MVPLHYLRIQCLTPFFLAGGILLPVFFPLAAGLAPGAWAEEPPWGTGHWDPDRFGNHRAVIRVEDRDDAVRVRIPWRRRDPDPEKKGIIVQDGRTGRRVTNVVRLHVERAFGEVAFQPVSGPGTYYVYYLPYEGTVTAHYPEIRYSPPRDEADPAWRGRCGLTPEAVRNGAWKVLPEAKVERFEAADPFHSFHPMELAATDEEVARLLARHPGRSFLLFPEDREHSIRMTRFLPRRWVRAGAERPFRGRARPGEFYVFQVGVFAGRRAVHGLEVVFHDLKAPSGGARIPARAFRCFNTGGIDWEGRPFRKAVDVVKGRVQALFMGVDVPEDLPPGTYQGTLGIRAPGLEQGVISLALEVSGEPAKDHGDDNPFLLSRLRWLDSRVGIEGGVVRPYTAVRRSGGTLHVLGRSVTLDAQGFPGEITSFFDPEITLLREAGRPLLAGPVRLVVEDVEGEIHALEGEGVRFTKESAAAAAWASAGTAGTLTATVRGRLEFDGALIYEVEVRPLGRKPVVVRDLRLEIPLAPGVARYMMGLGYKGGFVPDRFAWRWDPAKNQDALWIGDVNGGLQVALRDERYARPLNTNFYTLKPLVMPASWWNEGHGGVRVEKGAAGGVGFTAFGGPRTLAPEAVLRFDFRLLITPFRLLDTAGHFRRRYFHRYAPLEEIAAAGANVINVHHATEINPYINYPFLRLNALKRYVDAAHARGFEVKIYDTVRELSNHAPELFALRSLDEGIFAPGPGGGPSWLQEHLVENYIAGWFVHDLEDAAVVMGGQSRWHNYYLEGLRYLVEHGGIDGLYIDDVAFGRRVMQRARRILDARCDRPLVDLHSANQYNPRDGFASSANLYLELFPYVDRLWFGEYFDYDAPPEYWLVEMSGIPFGLMGEMLQDGGNPWRGMVYGMTNRLPWAGDPRPLWKVWDGFGIAESRMIGYWVPSCPVRTGREDVLATAYVRPGRALVAVASWAREPVSVRLHVDWEALGIEPARARIHAPAVEGFQEAVAFHPDEAVPVLPGRGWLLLLEGA